jgi:GNAT superfamily N-acetyltransferase
VQKTHAAEGTALPNDQISYQFVAPEPEAFVKLRSDCGWGEISLDAATAALQRSVIDLTVFEGDRLIGMGRVVGDGVLYFYLQDIIVLPTHRNQSIGRQIVSRLLEQSLARAATGATIGLMSAKGKETFYRHFGFQERPTDRLGAGMTLFVLPE